MDPIGVLGADDFIYGPGAVSVIRKDQKIYEVLICNNYGNRVTKHVIDLSSVCTLRNSEVLLNKWLDFPDGVSVSGNWIAISNWGLRNVLLYDSVGPLNDHSDPAGILSCIYRPHGVKFTYDGRFLLVADYEGHYVHIYRKDDSGWRGVRSPVKSLKVMHDAGSHERDGAKGLDIDFSSTTLVMTCEEEPLAFFDFAAIVEECEKQKTCPVEYQLEYELNRSSEVQRTDEHPILENYGPVAPGEVVPRPTMGVSRPSAGGAGAYAKEALKRREFWRVIALPVSCGGRICVLA